MALGPFSTYTPPQPDSICSLIEQKLNQKIELTRLLSIMAHNQHWTREEIIEITDLVLCQEIMES